jgi:hypothetical protein
MIDCVKQQLIVVDSSRHPLVYLRMAVGFGDADLESMLRQFELLLYRGQRYTLLVYCDPAAKVMTARQRKMVSEWYRMRTEQVRRINVGTAIVIDSTLVRGAMTAFNWLIEPIAPQANVATIRDGIDFCIARLKEAEMTVSDDIYAMREIPDRKLKQLA